MELTKKTVEDALTDVLDPELNISIVDLGLVYDIKIDKNKENKPTVKVVMTLTTIGCPLFSLIEREVRDKLSELGFEDNNIDLELTFEPPWTMERISERAKALLGI